MESNDVFTYEIRVEEQLSEHWSEWFDGMQLGYGDQNEMVMTGVLPDQAALYSVLMKIRNLGLTIISVRRIGIDERESPT